MVTQTPTFASFGFRQSQKLSQKKLDSQTILDFIPLAAVPIFQCHGFRWQFMLAFVVLVNTNACQTLSHNLWCALALFWLFVHPLHTRTQFFLTWCVQGILDLCKQVRIYLSVEMPNGAKWQRRRLVLKRNLCDGFLSNVIFWSI